MNIRYTTLRRREGSGIFFLSKNDVASTAADSQLGKKQLVAFRRRLLAIEQTMRKTPDNESRLPITKIQTRT